MVLSSRRSPGPGSREQLNVEPSARKLPGDAGFWTFIAADAVLFALLFFQFSLDRSSHRKLFDAGQGVLEPRIALANTLVLISSSWVVALAVRAHSAGRTLTACRLVYATAGLGVVFAGLKVSEYVREINGGHTVSTSLFFTYYFMITAIHLAHLLVGTVAMVVMGARLRRAGGSPKERVYLECVASYWHLVDLLWLFIFPLLYLAR